MTNEPAGAAPEPMERHGAYNRNSRVQAAGISPALPLLERAARVVPLAEGTEPIVIADYGASEGKNSLAPMRVTIAALFETLAAPESYLGGDPAAFASAIGRSFYEQILPTASVTLGRSSWAVPWLSRSPGPIPGQLQVAWSHAPRHSRSMRARRPKIGGTSSPIVGGSSARVGGSS